MDRATRSTIPGAVLGLVAVLGLAVPTLAAPPVPANPVNGKRLSERWCAACHVVSADQTRASADVPTFEALANAPTKTPDGIADFLTLPGTTHSKMPDLALSRVEIDDIAAYIATLKK